MRDKKRKVNRKKCRKILAWKKWVAAAAALTLLVGTGTSFTYAQQPAGYETADGAAGEGSDVVTEKGSSYTEKMVTESEGKASQGEMSEMDQSQTDSTKTVQPGIETNDIAGDTVSGIEGDDPANEVVEKAPQAVALPILEESLDKVEAKAAEGDVYKVDQYAAESITVKLGDTQVEFKGGSLIKGKNEDIPEYAGTGAKRSFAWAGFTYPNGDEDPVKVSGLYPYDTGSGIEWYYTSDEEDHVDSTGGGLGGIDAGYLLPSNVDVRFYYELEAENTYKITNNLNNGGNGSWNAVITTSGGGLQAKEGEWVTVEVTLDSKLQRALIRKAGNTSGTQYFGLAREESDRSALLGNEGDSPTPSTASPLEWAELLSTDTDRFRFRFQMPNEPVTLDIAFAGEWVDDGDNKIWVGTYVGDSSFSDQNSRGLIRLYARLNGSGGVISYQPQYNTTGTDKGYGNIQQGGEPHSMIQKLQKGTMSAANRDNYTRGGSFTGSNGTMLNNVIRETVVDPSNPTKKGKTAIQQLNIDTSYRFQLDVAVWTTYATSDGDHEAVPRGIFVDVYKNGGNFEGEDFVRTYVELPNKVGGTTSMNLPRGGRVDITCNYFRDRNAYVTRNDGGGSTVGTTTLSEVYSFDPYGFVYTINVSNVHNDFKLVYDNFINTVQDNYQIQSVEGVKEGVSRNGTITGSYVEKANGKVPLSESIYLWANNVAIDGGHYLWLEPLEGYGLPKIETHGWNSTDHPKATGKYAGPKLNADGTISTTFKDGKYRYLYLYEGNDDAKKLAGFDKTKDLLGEISIKAEPIKFDIGYYRPSDTSSSYSSPGLSLSYDNRENYVIQSTVPSGVTTLSGFNLEVWTKAEAGITPVKVDEFTYQELYPDSTDHTMDKWIPGDVIAVRDLYNALNKAGTLAGGTSNYEIRLVMQEGQNGWLVKGAKFNIYTQGDWFASQTGSSPYPVDMNTAFSPKEYLVDAYDETMIVLGNYPERFKGDAWTDNQNQTAKYVLDQTNSKTSGKVSQASKDTAIGWLYYLSAANVQIVTPPDANLGTNTISQWNTNNADTWYIGANIDVGDGQTKHALDLNTIKSEAQIPDQTNDGRKFNGWWIIDSSTATADETPLYSIPAGNGSIDLSSLGSGDQNAQDAWNAIFGSMSAGSITAGTGTVYLMPVYGNSTNPIKRPDSYSDQIKKLYGTPYSFDTQFTMEGRVNENSTAQFVVYRAEGGGTDWKVCVGGTIDLYNKTVDKKTNNHFYGNLNNANITVDTSYDDVSDQTAITLNVGEGFTEGRTGSIYRVYMWNEANGNLNILDGNNIKHGYRETIAQLTSEYPYTVTTMRLIPKVYSSGAGTVTEETPKSKMIYEEEGFTISADFTLETGKETVEQLLADNSGAEDGRGTELHIALYKAGTEEAGENEVYDLWKSNWNNSGSTGHEGKIGKMKIVPSGTNEREFTVTVEILGGNAIIKKWEDGAKYRIFAWTETNEANSPLGKQVSDSFSSDPTDTNAINRTRNIPSVTTTMYCIVKDGVGNIIKYPKQVVMMDNVVSGDKKIYSGNEKVTLTPVSGAEIPNPDTGLDVKIQGIDTAPNNSFNITNAGKNIAIQCFAGTIGGSGTSASPVTGTIGNIKCPTGGASSSSLPFYFRSLNAPNAVDGEVYSGTIQFVFSHTVSTN